MPLDFPSSPAVGQYYNGYIWDGTVWDSALQPSVPALLTTAPVYANESARTSAVPSPAEGQLSYLNDINQFQGYAGTSWRPLGGLAPIVAPTIRVSGGSATSNSSGVVSFSGATSIGLDNVFTSAYTNYKIFLNISTASATAATAFRYTSGGTITSSSLWYTTGAYWGVNGAGTSTVGNGTADIAVNVAVSTGYNNTKSVADITITNNRLISNYSGFPNAAGGSLAYGLWNEQNPTHDGFRLNPTSGTITGTVAIYGLN